MPMANGNGKLKFHTDTSHSWIHLHILFALACGDLVYLHAILAAVCSLAETTATMLKI